jgi:hypothetical protein
MSGMSNLQQNILNDFVVPELKRRGEAGQPFAEPVWAAQVMFRAGAPPEVRVNAEVRLRAKTINSPEWVDYHHVPKHVGPRIVAVDLWPEEDGTDHLTFCLSGMSADFIVWPEVGGETRRRVERPAYVRLAENAPADEAWPALYSEHDRVAGLVLGSINSPVPEIPVEVVMAVALQRSRHLLQAYTAVREQRNITAASAIIRMQLDSAMRVNACFLVEEPLRLWGLLKEGEPWSQLRSAEGRNLSDSYLHQKLTERFEWASELYKRMSGFIHLSRPHLEAATAGDDFPGMMIFQGPAGERVTDDQLNDNAALFLKTTSALLQICEEYASSRGTA